MTTTRTIEIPVQRIPEWTFGDRIRKVRIMLGLSQIEFGELIGEKGSTYSAWESGRNTPGDLIAAARRIERVTDVPAAWILGVLPRLDSNQQPSGSLYPQVERGDILEFPTDRLPRRRRMRVEATNRVSPIRRSA